MLNLFIENESFAQKSNVLSVKQPRCDIVRVHIVWIDWPSKYFRFQRRTVRQYLAWSSLSKSISGILGASSSFIQLTLRTWATDASTTWFLTSPSAWTGQWRIQILIRGWTQTNRHWVILWSVIKIKFTRVIHLLILWWNEPSAMVKQGWMIVVIVNHPIFWKSYQSYSYLITDFGVYTKVQEYLIEHMLRM